MAIREKKNKDGTTSFYITVYEGYKIDTGNDGMCI